MLKDIGKLLVILPILTKLAQYINELVKMAEEEDVEDGVAHGEEKKNLVLNIVDAVYDGAVAAIGTLPLAKDVVINTASKMIDAIVAFLNAINIFKSKSQ